MDGSRSKRSRSYWLRLGALFGVTLAVALLVTPIGLGMLLMWIITHPGCGVGPSPAAYDLAYEDVSFVNEHGLTLRGYFIPGTRAGTVIIVPPLGSDRGGELEDAAVLNQSGLNVLTFDARTCAGASFHSLGYLEVEDVEAAYTYLRARTDTNSTPVSLHGFSSAGATSLMAAVRLPDVLGVLAKGGYHNFAEQLGLTNSGTPLDHLVALGAEAGYRLITGYDVRALNPLGAVELIGPRPLLLVYGSREVSLPGARAMLAVANAAGGNAALYIVEGASHGNYLAVAGEAYTQRIVDFHHRVLLGAPSPN